MAHEIVVSSLEGLGSYSYFPKKLGDAVKSGAVFLSTPRGHGGGLQ